MARKRPSEASEACRKDMAVGPCQARHCKNREHTHISRDLQGRSICNSRQYNQGSKTESRVKSFLFVGASLAL